MQKLLKARKVHNMGETILERGNRLSQMGGLQGWWGGFPPASPSNEALTRDGLDTSVISWILEFETRLELSKL